MWFPEDENSLMIYNTIVDRDYGSVIMNAHYSGLLIGLIFQYMILIEKELWP